MWLGIAMQAIHNKREAIHTPEISSVGSGLSLNQSYSFGDLDCIKARK